MITATFVPRSFHRHGASHTIRTGRSLSIRDNPPICREPRAIRRRPPPAAESPAPQKSPQRPVSILFCVSSASFLATWRSPKKKSCLHARVPDLYRVQPQAFKNPRESVVFLARRPQAKGLCSRRVRLGSGRAARTPCGFLVLSTSPCRAQLFFRRRPSV